LFRKKRKIDRMKLIQTISFLRVMENKIRFIENRVRNNSEKRFQEIISHYAKGDNDYVKVIAGEVAEQRKLANNIGRMRIGIERIRLRLETLLDLGGTVDMLKDVTPMLKDLRKMGMEAIPEFGIMFSELQHKLADIGVEMNVEGYVPFSPPKVEVDSEDVQKILKEAAEIASERVNSSIPQPP
jgi:division protein CdvB (Snf7/Vps24/ESCRT-III family)